MSPDYRQYSLEDLEGVQRNIDESRYPERYQAVLSELRRRRSGIEAEQKSKLCPSCSGPLKKETVRPYMLPKTWGPGLIAELLLWVFCGIFVALFALSYWQAAMFAALPAFLAAVLFTRRRIPGYRCQHCGAQYAGWQVEN